MRVCVCIHLYMRESSWSWYRREFLKELKVQIQEEKINNLIPIKSRTSVYLKIAPAVTVKLFAVCNLQRCEYPEIGNSVWVTAFNRHFWEEEMILWYTYKFAKIKTCDNSKNWQGCWMTGTFIHCNAGGNASWFL